jgi:molybdate transport system substrate-binding protein
MISAAMLTAAGCGNNSDKEAKVTLTISAAASLVDALGEIEKTYEAEHKNVDLTFNYGASGTLQHQIEQGAPADLFLSASQNNMQALIDKQLVTDDQHMDLLKNSLVVVTAADSDLIINDLNDLTADSFKRIAIGIPESVPAGSYAKEALDQAGIWDALQSKTVQAKDVRQVLQYVETGNVDAGFVYKTDALTSSQSKVAFVVDDASHKPIVYPIGIVKATKHEKEAGDFYDYLQSKAALSIFAEYGFSAK